MFCPFCGSHAGSTGQRSCPICGRPLNDGLPGEHELVGWTANGRLEVEELLEAGGPRCVYGVRDRLSGLRFALVVLSRSGSESPSERERLVFEARVGGLLFHPVLTAVIDFGPVRFARDGAPGQQLDLLAVQLERPRGEPVVRRLRRVDRPVRGAVGLLRDLAEALAELHERGYCHGGVRPENVLACEAAGPHTAFKLASPAALSCAGGVGEGQGSDLRDLAALIRVLLSDAGSSEASGSEPPGALPAEVPAWLRGLLERMERAGVEGELISARAVVAAVEQGEGSGNGRPRRPGNRGLARGPDTRGAICAAMRAGDPRELWQLGIDLIGSDPALVMEVAFALRGLLAFEDAADLLSRLEQSPAVIGTAASVEARVHRALCLTRTGDPLLQREAALLVRGLDVHLRGDTAPAFRGRLLEELFRLQVFRGGIAGASAGVGRDCLWAAAEQHAEAARQAGPAAFLPGLRAFTLLEIEEHLERLTGDPRATHRVGDHRRYLAPRLRELVERGLARGIDRCPMDHARYRRSASRLELELVSGSAGREALSDLTRATLERAEGDLLLLAGTRERLDLLLLLGFSPASEDADQLAGERAIQRAHAALDAAIVGPSPGAVA